MGNRNKLLNMNISNYDEYLFIENKLNGSKNILRRSPFKYKNYLIFKIKNRFIGSGRWILKKLYEMDTQKHDIIPKYIKQHKRPSLKKEGAMHKDIAQFIIKNEQIIV